MKFTKGLFDDLIEESKAPNAVVDTTAAAPEPPPTVAVPPPVAPRPVVVVEKEHLFETQQKVVESSRNYLRLFVIVIIFIAIAGTAIFYITLPGVGDRIRVAPEMEDAVRNHFLEKEKRTAGDITFYKCDNFTWARVEVETRTDIPGNPVFKVSKYSARATPRTSGSWDITAAPITSPELDKPCS